MSIQSIFISATDKSFLVKNGNLQYNNILLTAAYTRLITQLGSYSINPNFGSLLSFWINNRQILTVDVINKEINRALQDLKTLQLCNTIIPKVLQLNNSTGTLILAIYLIDSNNQQFKLPMTFTRQAGDY